MSQFEEDGYSLYVEEVVKDLEEHRYQRQKEVKETGYKVYWYWKNRLKRWWYDRIGKKYISYEEWQKSVDDFVSKNIR